MRASVVIPSYNAASTLAETLDSIIPQLTDQDEIIIVDDGSTDHTQAIVQPYLTANIRYFHQPNSGGPAAPRNKGIAEARGKYIFLFDSDDLMLLGKLQKSVESLACHPDAGLLFTNFQTINGAGKLLQRRFVDQYTFVAQLKQFSKTTIYRIEPPTACIQLAKENFIGTSSVVLNADALRKTVKFDESVKNGDDRDMWFKITRSFPVIFLDSELHSYRIREGSISMGNDTKRAESKIRVLKRQLENPVNEEFENDIHHLLSKNYHDIAYDAINQRQTKTALRNIRHALDHEFSKRNLGLLVKILLGPKFLAFFRLIKHRILLLRG